VPDTATLDRSRALIAESLRQFTSDLGYKVFLDRYTVKDLERRFEVGDVALVLLADDPQWPKKEVGLVLEVSGDALQVEIVTGPQRGEILERPRQECDRPVERTPQDLWRRVAAAVAACEPEPVRGHWQGAFYEALSGWRFVPGGRILAGAGASDQLTLYNCVAAETPVHTRAGIRPIGSLRGPVEILTQGGVYRTAVFGSYGVQRLYRVLLENGDTVDATAGHEWIALRPDGGQEVVTTLALQGRSIPVQPPAKPRADRRGVAHGLTFGLGARPDGRDGAAVEVPDSRAAVVRLLEPHAHPVGAAAAGRQVMTGLPAAWAALPTDGAPAAYWRGFIVGLIAACGRVERDGHVSLALSAPVAVEAVRRHAARAGFIASAVGDLRQAVNQGPTGGGAVIQLHAATVVAADMILPEHRLRLAARPEPVGAVRVVAVTPTLRREEVFCCSEPVTHTMVVGQGYLTRQCYVVPSPKDSRRGIIETLSQMIEIMSRGGGVGINVSSLRPRRAVVRGVNGRSSGAVSWMDLYSRATGLVEQGGSRRGALMLMMWDWHPDLLRFIDAKRTPGMVENANISVCVTDAFMHAVKNDLDWSLRFPDTDHPRYDELWDGDLEAWERQGLPVVTYARMPAREIWSRLIESAWASAEPGIAFLDRANKESNSRYFHPLIATNPCVTGDTWISTADGLRRADELYVSQKPVEAVVDGRMGAGRTRPASRVFLTGLKPVVRLRTREGYEVRLTPDHRVMTDRRGFVPASRLRVGEAIRLVNHAGGFGTFGDESLGRVLGWAASRGAAGPALEPEQERDLLPCLAAAVQRVTGEPLGTATGRVRRGGAALLAEVASDHGLAAAEGSLAEGVMRGSRELQRGFLQALFEADGDLVQVDHGPPCLRLEDLDAGRLRDVQRVLLNLGIVTRLEQGLERTPALVVEGAFLARFEAEVGVLSRLKQSRLALAAERVRRSGAREKYVCHVESIQPDGVEPVYDLTEPVTHSFVAGGLVVHNCAEQPLPAWGVCCLGHVNLARFVVEPGDGRPAEIDWDGLGRTVRSAVRFLDDVVDTTPYHFPENRAVQQAERRLGLGTMGLGEVLIRLGVRYGSPESVALVDRLYGFVAHEAYLASAEIAAEKGPFPNFDAERLLDSGFMRSMPEDVRERVREAGLRNVTLLTQAPTGTVGTMVGTSTGIEPFYALKYFRQSRLGFDEQYVTVAQEWLDAHPGQELPPAFVGAMDLTPEEHIRIQAAVQRWTDSSISKTANAPADYTVEDTRRLYELAYDLGCKGVTIYRDQSRHEQVLHVAAADKPGAPGAPSAAEGADPGPPLKGRPRRMTGVCYLVPTHFGNLTLDVHEDADGQPFEVIASAGTAGSDLMADAVALGMAVSVMLRLRSPVPIEERLGVIIDKFRNIGGSKPGLFGPFAAASLAQGLARGLEQYLEERRGGGTGPSRPPAAPAVDAPLPDGPGAQAARQGASVDAAFDLCPSCGTYSMEMVEGCRTCHACGFSNCS
jgi:ribonucleoside-diphosphate reductase alpha chain